MKKGDNPAGPLPPAVPPAADGTGSSWPGVIELLVGRVIVRLVIMTFFITFLVVIIKSEFISKQRTKLFGLEFGPDASPQHQGEEAKKDVSDWRLIALAEGLGIEVWSFDVFYAEGSDDRKNGGGYVEVTPRTLLSTGSSIPYFPLTLGGASTTQALSVYGGPKVVGIDLDVKTMSSAASSEVLRHFVGTVHLTLSNKKWERSSTTLPLGKSSGDGSVLVTVASSPTYDW